MEAPGDNHEDANATKRNRTMRDCDESFEDGFLLLNAISVEASHHRCGRFEILRKSAVPCFPGRVLAAKFRASVIRCSRAN